MNRFTLCRWKSPQKWKDSPASPTTARSAPGARHLTPRALYAWLPRSLSNSTRSRRLLVDANLLEQVARDALRLLHPRRVVLVRVRRRTLGELARRPGARRGHVHPLGVGGGEHRVDHPRAALPLVLADGPAVGALPVECLFGVRRHVDDGRAGLLVVHDEAQVVEEVRVLLVAERDGEAGGGGQLALQVARAVEVAPAEVMQDPHEPQRPLGPLRLRALGERALGRLERARHQLRRRDAAPVRAEERREQPLLLGEVRAHVCRQLVHPAAQLLRGAAPRLGERVDRRDLVEDLHLEPRDGVHLQLHLAVVRECGAARLTRQLAAREQPVVVHRHLDGVLLAHEEAPAAEEAEERAHAPRLGQVAEVVHLHRALHLEHVAAQRLVREQQQLLRPVEQREPRLVDALAQHGRGEPAAREQLLRVLVGDLHLPLLLDAHLTRAARRALHRRGRRPRRRRAVGRRRREAEDVDAEREVDPRAERGHHLPRPLVDLHQRARRVLDQNVRRREHAARAPHEQPRRRRAPRAGEAAVGRGRRAWRARAAPGARLAQVDARDGRRRAGGEKPHAHAVLAVVVGVGWGGGGGAGAGGGGGGGGVGRLGALLDAQEGGRLGWRRHRSRRVRRR
mmetsp:Transcript_49101/g.121920  ORF Transcript_49101/g.121920 Transcript_49101/m.121920 type:complete len:624 (+) Transcript_49101:322-2193(+)